MTSEGPSDIDLDRTSLAAAPYQESGGEEDMIRVLLWVILLVLCWPLALLVLLLYPIIWLLLLPFRLVGLAVDAVFQLLHAVLMLPARAIRAVSGA